MTDETQEQRERRGHESVAARAALGQCLQCGAGLEPLAEVYNAWQRRTCPACGAVRSDWRGRPTEHADDATADAREGRTAAIGDRRHRAAARASSKTGRPEEPAE